MQENLLPKLVNKLFLFVSYVLLIFSTITLPTSCSNKKESNTLLIESIHDGDTFKGTDGKNYRVFGIDTPELNDQYNEFVPTEGIQQIYAQEALFQTKQLLENKRVEIELKATDKYNRNVVKVSVNKQDLGLALISLGLARVAYINVSNPKSPFYSDDYSYYKSLTWAQYKAFTEHLGVWRSYSEFKIIFPKA